jgi:SAM-dependent methyltransferase
LFIKYGKSINNLLKIKKSFITDNSVFLEKQKKIADELSKQPLKTSCKICGTKPSESFFEKNGIKFFQCEKCTHLNSIHDETNEFLESLYTEDKGHNYAKSYIEQQREDYINRTETIYTPKVEFLSDFLESKGESLKENRIVDFGCGSGYFLYALEKLGIDNARGYEVSESQASYGNSLLKSNKITPFNINEAGSISSKLDCEIISFIGVLEHMKSPHDVFKGIAKNKAIKYIYLSVPLYSFSVFVEMAFQNVMARQLSGGHTHLFTKESLTYLANEYDFEIAAQWWFGTDIMDMFRSIIVTINGNRGTENAVGKFESRFMKMVDNLQMELDKEQLSSEVHMVLSRKAN